MFKTYFFFRFFACCREAFVGVGSFVACAVGCTAVSCSVVVFVAVGRTHVARPSAHRPFLGGIDEGCFAEAFGRPVLATETEGLIQISEES